MEIGKNSELILNQYMCSEYRYVLGWYHPVLVPDQYSPNQGLSY